ncbi:hypothetical protein CWM22_04510 [Streptococcus suis]|uniref:Uncharacterized protein n=1 Tax=Streptococcus suis TaxID=1307 RepID=A0A2I5N383_STRSU|nr:hypothetical protein CWM22_04510 [Streptococcus suis]QOZ88656.1 hypothetical protein D2E16_04425 [Streptococcus suis]RRN48059.1 hypothetical protein EI220_12230 [Streptococcus suis]
MGKNSTSQQRVRFPTPAQLIRSDLECNTRTNLPINHCAEMLTLTLRSVLPDSAIKKSNEKDVVD